ncbi:MAG: HNH endonuclease [Propionibacteriaceae bacterium]
MFRRETPHRRRRRADQSVGGARHWWCATAAACSRAGTAHRRDAHHVIPWHAGGKTSLENLATSVELVHLPALPGRGVEAQPL